MQSCLEEIMELWIPKDWNTSFDHEGLLFFVQKIQEMSFHYSDDIHRAPVHNTSTLINEYLLIHSDVKQGNTKSYQLTPIYDEIKDSLLHDAILRENLGDYFIDDLYLQMKSCPETNKFNMVSYIHGVITPFYFKWTTDYLKQHIPEGKHKIEIEKGSRTWISELIMRGYTGEFIYYYVKHFFIDKKIKSIDSIEQFFQRFDFTKRNYKVYIYISNDMSKYFEMLSSRLSLVFVDNPDFNIKPKKNFSLCYFEIEALDHYKAITSSYNKISIFLKQYQFISDTQNDVIGKFCIVYDEENKKKHKLPIIPSGFKTKRLSTAYISPNLIDTTIISIQERRNKSAERFYKALTLHNSAIKQALPKDGFINLWSILEVLCPQCDYDSKLEPIIDQLLPILQNDYFTVTFHSILDDLEKNMDPNDYLELMNSLSGADDLEKIASFCLLSSYEKLREDVFLKLKNYPLIRQKIYSIYILRKDKKEFYSRAKRYAQRVKWHLYRLYRARNSIVHAGKTPLRIQVLGEHLHSYVDSIMFEVTLKFSISTALNDISSIFIDTSLMVSAKEEHFNKGGEIQKEDIQFLFEKCYHPISLYEPQI